MQYLKSEYVDGKMPSFRVFPQLLPDSSLISQTFTHSTTVYKPLNSELSS